MQLNDDTLPDLPQSWTKENLQLVDVLGIFLLAGVIPAVSFWFADAKMVNWILPLCVLIPLLSGLFYGFWGGMSAALFLAGIVWGVFNYGPGVLTEFPVRYIVVWLVCGGIAGQCRDFWALHLRRMQSLSSYHQMRLAQFGSAFHLLELSHSQLERQLMGTTISLRSSMQQLRAKLQATEIDTTLPLGGIGSLLLEFLAQFGTLHVASIYAINQATDGTGKEHGELAAVPVSMVGEAPALSPAHPLLLEALQTGVVTSVGPTTTTIDDVIAIVPLMDSMRRIHGVVSINAMPFVSIHQHTFDLLGIIARQMGDILVGHDELGQDVGADHTLPARLKHALQNAQRSSLPVAIIAYKIFETDHGNHVTPDHKGTMSAFSPNISPAGRGEVRNESLGDSHINTQQASLIRLCCEVNRGVDQSWKSHDRSGHPIIMNFLLMADESVARLQLQRLRQRIIEQHGRVVASRNLQSLIWEIKAGELTADQAVDQLVEKICLACDVEHTMSTPDVVDSTVLVS